MIIGSHVSFKGQEQIIGSINEALNYGANTFMFYTGAPQNTNRSPIDIELVNLGKKVLKEQNIDINNIIVHAPYIINPANRNNEDFNVSFLREEIRRVESLGVTLLVLHPGSHVGLGIEQGLKNVVYLLNRAMTNDMNVTICLETMAGKGTELCSKFEEIKYILDNVDVKNKLKVCLDTCHVFDSGYKLDGVIDEFDKIIGLNKLACIHINDSKNGLGSHKDRHENIGLGLIGFDSIMNIINDSRLKDVPKILETPYVTKDEGGKDKVYPPYKFEIEMIKSNKYNINLIEDIRNYYK